jgi:uncharacterized membrane protein YphA (DoxX/SURF4 family)
MSEKKQCWCIDVGLFVLRLGIGAAFVLHGLPKLLGGIPQWEGLGQAGLGAFGLGGFYPVVWGFLAAFAECVGGLALMAGFLTRLFSFLLLCTMVAAAAMHVNAFIHESSPAKQSGQWNSYEFWMNGKELNNPLKLTVGPEEGGEPAPSYSYKNGFTATSHAAEAAVVFLALLIMGAGRIRIGRLLRKPGDGAAAPRDEDDDTKTAMRPPGAGAAAPGTPLSQTPSPEPEPARPAPAEPRLGGFEPRSSEEPADDDDDSGGDDGGDDD